MSDERRGRERPEGTPVLSLAQLEAIRLVLRGGSVIDWYRLNFDDEDDARSLVRLLEGDPDDQGDVARMAALRSSSASYLTDTLGYRIPEPLLSCPALELFAYASEKRGRRRDRFFACLLLKTMHILLHIEARELRYRLPMSQSEIAGLVVQKVDAFARGLEAEAFPLASYVGGEKSKTSLLTKLLVKREHHAAAIHDRVRFRFVVERASDLLPLLHRMTGELVPFSYVVPGETVNHLVNFTALVESHEAYRERAELFQVELGHEESRMQQLNEFSGPTYRVINFVVDVPVRVPQRLLTEAENLEGLGRVIFSLAEFQIVDRTAAAENELGDNRHDRYRARKLTTVRERLERGLRGADMETDEA
jgi:uncharacterized protein (TIGR04552 family)